MPFPVAAAIGLGTGILSLFGKKKPKDYQTPMSKEDLARRKTWLDYMQNKIYNQPNLGNQAWGQSLGLLQNSYLRGGGQGQSMGYPQAQMNPNQMPQSGPNTGPNPMPNPFFDLMNRRNQQQGVLRYRG